MTALRLGTRRSALARTQSSQVARALSERTGRAVTLVEISTHGDVSRAALTEIGGTGVFVSALREALIAEQVDLAVHSLKDLPTGDPVQVHLAAVPPREDARDALVARGGATLAELPSGARVGTGSPRRAAQLRALGFGLDVVPVRGNVDTRLGYVTSGQLDAVVLARAGLARLGRLDVVTEVFDPIQMLPAPGQGALAVECRAPEGAPEGALDGAAEAGADDVDGGVDASLPALLGMLDDPATRAAVTAERVLLNELEAGCSAPIGAYAEVVEGDEELELYLRAAVTSLDGAASVRLSAHGPVHDAAGLGRRLATRLLAEGAGELMGERMR